MIETKYYLNLEGLTKVILQLSEIINTMFATEDDINNIFEKLKN